MILESSAQDVHPSAILEKTMAAAADKPPAYSTINDEYTSAHPSGSGRGGRRQDHRGRGYVPHPDANRSLPQAAPTVDQVHVFDRKQNIEGTFHIDPSIPMLDPSKRQKHKGSEPFPDASFRTLHGEIDLHLGTTGDARQHPKANVHVGSRHGFIKVTLLPFSPERPRFGLKLQSRQGKVALFLPDNFAGVIQLSTRRGTINILPALQRRMKVVKSSEHDSIIMVGNANEDTDGIQEVSFCELTSRTGDVIVGLDGSDKYIPPVGLWKKITGALKGSSSHS